MSKGQLEQDLDTAIAASLREAGLGKRYCAKDKKLSDLGAIGKDITRDAEKGELSEIVRQGKSIVIVGAGLLGVELQMMTARALILKRFGIKVVGVHYLLKLRNEEIAQGAFAQEVLTAKGLCVTGWYEPHYPDGLRGDDRFELELFFRRQIENGVSLLLQTPVPLPEVKWWSNSLLEMLEAMAKIYTVPQEMKPGRVIPRS